MVPLIEYLPALKKTVCPDGQEARAELIWATVAEELKVAQIVVLAGIPPGTPTAVQSMAHCWLLEVHVFDPLVGYNKPDHNWACKQP